MPVHELMRAAETIEAAPAKINIALHVTGQRADGYHLLDMLVTFTEAGDVIRIQDADEDSFSLSGRFAKALEDCDPQANLVLKARDLLRKAAHIPGFPAPSPVAIHLEKNLPVASGIGGGSADAAATLRGLARHWELPLPISALGALGLKLGADVPMCIVSRPLIARGIGEEITTLAQFPSLAMVLVNPLQAVSTPHIFRLLQNKNNAPLPAIIDDSEADWMQVIETMRNDLQPSATQVLPVIGDILAMLSQEGAKIVRMSGSGATCFGLFATPEKAVEAAGRLRAKRPDWYIEATTTKAGAF